jgi:diguanylate cyclase
MTAYDPDFPPAGSASPSQTPRRRSRFLQWFGRSSDDYGETVFGEPAPPPDVRTLREMRAELQSPLLKEMGEFLAGHGLEIMPYTLNVAFDCVTGYNPWLAEQVRERAEGGQPVTITWLEDISRESGRSREEAMLASLMGRLEESLDEFGRTTSSAKAATNEYNSALKQHVDDLEQVSKAGVVISELATLAQAMIERTRTIESELGRSEKRARALQKNLEEAQRAADHDHLTGLPNRRSFEQLLDREYKEAKAAREPLCVAFCDIDLFKRINDTHGHAAGDRVLKVVAETLARISDDKCHVARHGGEEFAVLFRGCSPREAFERLDSARQDIAERRLVNRATDMPFGQVSFSGGLADLFAFKTKGAALKAADEALYRAKAEGRNRIVMAAGR